MYANSGSHISAGEWLIAAVVSLVIVVFAVASLSLIKDSPANGASPVGNSGSIEAEYGPVNQEAASEEKSGRMLDRIRERRSQRFCQPQRVAGYCTPQLNQRVPNYAYSQPVQPIPYVNPEYVRAPQPAPAVEESPYVFINGIKIMRSK